MISNIMHEIDNKKLSDTAISSTQNVKGFLTINPLSLRFDASSCAQECELDTKCYLALLKKTLPSECLNYNLKDGALFGGKNSIIKSNSPYFINDIDYTLWFKNTNIVPPYPSPPSSLVSLSLLPSLSTRTSSPSPSPPPLPPPYAPPVSPTHFPSLPSPYIPRSPPSTPTPSLPPSPPPNPPPYTPPNTPKHSLTYRLVATFVIQGTINEFDKNSFISKLSTYLNVNESDINIVVSASSKKVIAYIKTQSSSDGLVLKNKLQTSLGSLSSALNITINGIDTYVEPLPSSPPPPFSSSSDFTYLYWLSPTLVVLIVVISYLSIYTVLKRKGTRPKIATTTKENKNLETNTSDYVELIPLTKKKTKLPTSKNDLILK